MIGPTQTEIDNALISHGENIVSYLRSHGVDDHQRLSLIYLAEAWDKLSLDGRMDDALMSRLLARKNLWVQPAAQVAAVVPVSAATSSYNNSFAGLICRYMEEKKYELFKGSGEINIVYVEGCNADGSLNADEPNQFNDRRILITFENGAPKIIGNWEATTEPGFYYTDSPMNISGAARIKFGQYLNCWEVGTHGNSVPHEALIQIRPVTVYRDYNRDMARVGDKEDTGLFGINQHGGYDYPFGNIGPASAGCQVGRTMDGHEEFMRLIKTDPRYKKDHTFAFSAAILPGDEVVKRKKA